MSTKHNIELKVRENSGEVPNLLYEKSVQQFRDSGLIGRKHVNHFGRIFEGYDVSCDNIIRGYFDIFYRGNETRSMRETFEEEKLKASGFDETKQSAIELDELAVNILEKIDPLASLPVNTYYSMPSISSMEINTSAGIQSTHIHCKDGGIIYFWKPKKDKFWYDFDTFKDYVKDLQFGSLKNRLSILNIVSGYLERRNSLGLKAIENPDSVDKINWCNFI